MPGTRLADVPREPFVSTAARAEDVVLLRTLGHLPAVRVVEVTADGAPSATRALAALGWEARAVAVDDVDTALDVDAPPHALVVAATAAAGAARALAAGARPWLVVVAGTPDGEPDAALVALGYTPALFDGASWWYAAPGRTALLLPGDEPSGASAAPDEDASAAALAEAQAEAASWRSLAVDGWAQAVAELGPGRRGAEIQHAEAEAMRATLSWRITAPLRVVRGWIPR